MCVYRQKDTQTHSGSPTHTHTHTIQVLAAVGGDINDPWRNHPQGTDRHSQEVQGIISVGPSGGLMSDWKKGEEDDYTLHTNLGNRACPLMTT